MVGWRNLRILPLVNPSLQAHDCACYSDGSVARRGGVVRLVHWFCSALTELTWHTVQQRSVGVRRNSAAIGRCGDGTSDVGAVSEQGSVAEVSLARRGSGSVGGGSHVSPEKPCNRRQASCLLSSVRCRFSLPWQSRAGRRMELVELHRMYRAGLAFDRSAQFQRLLGGRIARLFPRSR